jgi:hypothetical protein
MIEILDDLKRYGIFVAVLICIGFIAVSGIFFGMTYYFLDITHTNFLSVNCVIENNALVTSCQELWDMSLYPFLNLRYVLVWFSYFFIFGLVIALLILGYHAGKSPVLMGVMVAFIGGITYLGIEISNIYRTMLESDVFSVMMVEFTVYNKIMLYFPWFCFFVGIFSIILSIVNFQKTIVNKDDQELNY